MNEPKPIESVSALWKEATRAGKAWVRNWASPLSKTDRARIVYVYRAGYIEARNSPNNQDVRVPPSRKP